jgi:hypothetical protein
MKKVIWGLALFLTSSVLFAQEIKVGAELGSSFAGFENTNDQILSQVDGISGGLFGSVQLGDFAIQPEVLYVEKGGAVLNQPTKFNVNYIEIPVLLKWYVIKTILNPAIFAGPFYAANVSSAVTNGEFTNINASDYGATVGVQIGLDDTFLSARWDISVGTVTSDTNIQNRDFILMLGQGI